MLCFRKVLTIICIGVIAAESNARPVVNGFVGELKLGNIIEVYGTDFGEMDGGIISWDDFEGHETGELINGSKSIIGGNWSTIYSYSGDGARFDTRESHSGNKAAHLDWSIDKESIRAFGWSGRGPYNKLYISYQRYMEGDYKAASGFNHKQFYLYGNNGQMPQSMPLMPGGTTMWGLYNNVSSGGLSWSEGNNINTEGWVYSNTVNKFQRWEWFIQLNSPYTESNGIVKGWLDGVKGIDNEKYRIGYVDGSFKDFRLGHMAQGFMDSAKAWFDDLYIATTQARVELCDSPVWKECKSKEIQVVDEDTWSDTGISFKLNSGFSNYTGSIYLYVVDKDGFANEKGFPLAYFNPIEAPKLSVD